MFSNLLTLSEKFGDLESHIGRQVVTEALAAWHESTSSDMYAFTKDWILTKRRDLLPLR